MMVLNTNTNSQIQQIFQPVHVTVTELTTVTFKKFPSTLLLVETKVARISQKIRFS